MTRSFSRPWGLVLWLLAMVALTGCQLYWTKPGGSLGIFNADHQDCAIAAGRPIQNDDRLLVDLDLYRACLRSRGWERVSGAKGGTPPGYMRGLEDEGPVRPGDVPQQVRQSAGHEVWCRAQWLDQRPDWRDRLPDFRACLEGR
jgi:hypothetical protein